MRITRMPSSVSTLRGASPRWPQAGAAVVEPAARSCQREGPPPGGRPGRVSIKRKPDSPWPKIANRSASPRCWLTSTPSRVATATYGPPRIARRGRRREHRQLRIGRGGLAEQPHGVGAAPRAMLHHRQIGGRRGADRLQARGRGRLDVAKRRAADRIQGHAIGNVGAQRGDLADDFRDVLIIDAGNDDRVDLHADAAAFQGGNRFRLAIPEQPGGGRAAIDPLRVADPGVNLRADFRIDGVDRQGDVARFQFGQFIDIGQDVQAVGSDAQKHPRMPPSDAPQGVQRRLGRGEWIARPGDADDGDPGVFFHDATQILFGLRRREDGAGHARPALVGAIVHPLAEVALDVAVRGDRQVDAAKRLARRR